MRKNISSLSLARLRQVLDYNPDTGWLTWRVCLSPRGVVGSRAGCVKGGYRRVAIDGRSYTASHLAWFHFHGVEPVAVVDHKNRFTDDNRIENLREATHSQNSMNIGPRSNNSVGLKGAQRFYNPGNRAGWRSTITVRGKRLFLGLFHTPEEAHEAYCKKAAELHGEFARTK